VTRGGETSALAAAACALIGVIVSGPVALAIVAAVKPQPDWSSAEAFAANYHPIQALPYFTGLLLVGGMVALISAMHGLTSDATRSRTRLAVVFAAAFASMILLNYTIQTTFIPALLAEATAGARALAGHLTMANPHALGWALEMWGYGVLGVATWLAAPVFGGRRIGKLTAALFRANGVASVLGAIATCALPGWVLEPAGILAFVAWNVLLAVMLVAAMVSLRGPARLV
jgi:hypothetical protein